MPEEKPTPKPSPEPKRKPAAGKKTATKKKAAPASGGMMDMLMGSPKPKKKKKKAPTGDGISDEELKTVEQLYEEGVQKVLDVIAPSGMEIGVRKIKLGDGTLARTFFAFNWPNQIDPNWLSPIVNYEAQMDISQYIYPSPNVATMKLLKRKVAEMRSSLSLRREKGLARDPALEAALEDAEWLRDMLARGYEKLFQFGLYITIYGENEEKLKKIQADIESVLGGKLVMTRSADFQMEHAWNSTLPICQDELEINRNMNTGPLATSFPFTSSDLTSDSGILYGINRHNESLVIFDRFKLPNANSTVFATSGAGKSYCVKLELIRMLMMGTDVYVIDPENEYTELSQMMGGTTIRLSTQSSECINPFDLPKPMKDSDADEDMQGANLLRGSVINLHGLFKLMIGEMTTDRESILDKAILDTYALKGMTIDTKGITEKEPPTMHDLVDVLSTTEGGEEMARILTKYTEGSFSGLFNKPTNINVNSQLMVFQTRDLEDAIRPMAIYIVLNYLWNEVRSSLKKRLIVVDEAWNVMQYDDSAKFLYGLIKRARKYYLGITTITQDVEDFMKSPYGKPIVTNAAMQMLLKQAPSAIDSLKKTFDLTEGEKYLLLNAGIGQGVFFAGRKHVAIQIVSSPKEHEIVTTNPEEVSRKNAEAKEAKIKKEIAKAAEEAKAEENEENPPENTSSETNTETTNDTEKDLAFPAPPEETSEDNKEDDPKFPAPPEKKE